MPRTIPGRDANGDSPDLGGCGAGRRLERRAPPAGQHADAARGSVADYGRYLYGAVAAHGVVDLGAEGRVTVARGGSPTAQVWRLTTEQMRGAIVGTGMVTEDDLERYLTLLENPDFTWLMPTMIAVWGRRPAA